MATIDDVNSTLQNIARQLGEQAQSQKNAVPNANASTSPVCYPYNNIGTSTATTVINANTKRYGLVFHNPGTATIYVYPNNITQAPVSASAPSYSSVGGSFIIYPSATLSFPSTMFANANGAWSAFSGTGSSQSFTVVEFI